MGETDLKQRLAAILAADVAGYSRLMATDDRATVAALDRARAVFKVQIESCQGRVIDMAGDSVLAVFETAAGAVNSALAIQEELGSAGADAPEDRRMRFRIGVHLGDVIEKTDGTVYGDGVNIAARLEGLAQPGGVTISESVYSAVRGKITAQFADQGEQQVKNIPHPVRAYCFVEGNADALVRTADPEPSPGVKPSIAVLPFDNLSNDREQEYFADGIADDLLTALSRYRWLMVAARNSSFSYKGKSTDIRQVGKDLGVRYVLEGSVRKSGNRVRVTVQLIDAESGNHVWAERFDRELADIFDVQDEITHTISGAIGPELSKAEQERARRKPVSSLDAWDLYQRGVWQFWRFSKKSNLEAQRLFGQAIALDPRFSAAYSALAYSHYSCCAQGYVDPQQALLLARRNALAALAIDDKDVLAHGTLGRVHTNLGEHAAALAELEIAASLNPNSAHGQFGLATGLLFSGRPEQSIAGFEAAERLSPHDQQLWLCQCLHARALALLGRYEAAESLARASANHPTATHHAYATLASILGHMGHDPEASEALAKTLEIKPDYGEIFYRTVEGMESGVKEFYLQGLYKAGLPRTPTKAI